MALDAMRWTECDHLALRIGNTFPAENCSAFILPECWCKWVSKMMDPAVA